MKYYKCKWNELRDDQFDDWGFSLWYLEIGDDDYPNRQIQIYENGKKLKYSQDYLDDKYGGLSDQKLYQSEFGGIECSKAEFENNWNN